MVKSLIESLQGSLHDVAVTTGNKTLFWKEHTRLNKSSRCVIYRTNIKRQQFKNLAKKYGFPDTCPVEHFSQHFRDFGKLYGPDKH